MSFRFTFPYPAKPFILNQAWGVSNEVYQQFGFGLHNGIDVAPSRDPKVISAPFPGTVVRVGNQLNGGGIFVGILSRDLYDFSDGLKAHVLLDALHCERITVREGQAILTGDTIAIPDNTGFSTGPHTHFQLRRVDENLNTLDQNDANNSFDPMPYATGVYAIDVRLSELNKLFSEIRAAALRILRPSSRINAWASAIAKFENMAKHHPENKNPGALRWSRFQTGLLDGYAAFATEADGWYALTWQLTIAADGRSTVYRPTDTLKQFFAKYAPANDNNDPDNYAAFVAKEIGISTDTQIKELL